MGCRHEKEPFDCVMAEARLNIGGLGVRLIGGDSVTHAMTLPGMKVFECPDAPEGIEVTLDAQVKMSHCRLLHQFDIVDGCMQCRFGVDGEGVYYYDFGGLALLRFDVRRPQRVELSPMVDPSVLRFALWSAYSIAGLGYNAVPVHSSVVVCDGRAVLCLGESGTGKSTHTRLWLGNIPNTHLLNDDSPIVRFDGQKVCVYGSPWSGKTDCYLDESYPIAGLLRLEQKKQNTIWRLGVVEAFVALQPSCPPCLAKEERCMDALVTFISNVIERVPAYRMGCLPDADAALLSHKTIMG